MGFKLPWARPPPPPPPPPPSLHLYLDVPPAQFILAAQACAAAALVLFLATLLLILLRKPSARKPVVSAPSTGSRAGQVAVLRCTASTALSEQVKRLLHQRGFADVRCCAAEPGLSEACRGAHVAIDLAYEGSGAGAADGALLAACAAHGVGSHVLCSDALVGYDVDGDVTDGDENWDAGPSLERTTPRVPVKHSGRLLALQRAEEALAEHQATTTARTGALIVRLHRVYSSGAEVHTCMDRDRGRGRDRA